MWSNLYFTESVIHLLYSYFPSTSKRNHKQNIPIKFSPFTNFFLYQGVFFAFTFSTKALHVAKVYPQFYNFTHLDLTLFLQMEYQHLLNTTHNMPGYEYNWICPFSLINDKSGILLEFQLRDIDNHLFVYFDTDQTPWLMCRKCKHKFHLNCITSMSPEEQLATGDFVCCV